MYPSSIASYYNNPFYFHFRIKHLISELQLRGDEKILDVGCGDGRITAEISQYLPQGYVVGIDCFPEIIEFAKSKFDRENYPNLDFQLGDARNLEFEMSFDIIVSFEALHYIHDHIPVLTRFKKALKPSGKILLSLLGEGSPTSIQFIAQELLLHSKWQELKKFRYGYYLSSEYREILTKVGFCTNSVEVVSYSISARSKREVKQRIEKDWLSLTSRIPPEIYDIFIEDLVNAYMERNPPNQSGLILSEETRLEITAKNLP
ncbi:MAG: class I SAM-dependent methyltransferase [Microcoleus sp. PH2017_15_JOR_U_A]|uniref:class I SAM-dependent methyltransferase n=1 Tax=unclassified Microcoleus TaxID=2642155 RepID=UPI001D26544B|nr:MULTISPECIES: class I SAM-dependent methyltransferase [unclassified Microcoleus]TAE71981.1 MAG: class I SAM-dependent methyltransferase [Oscillatoriales cyanobacterium]MCC3434158.1 class I SAM-dependent methyltransferase [Microcoleus sp. PH2017_05_CCC_O_A]MCC3500344.1 class I SAM-dependent methyltransferase [Microcoleus sp. PH2017_15_JOR_U_A]MCC3588476.1 class I SAM-dependent methyltransferase [Microcoleus sp. PH2017_30_WIL_O_A]MCC3590138.1 class I SAM-dependent methyltransferase [Microcole